MSAESRGEGFPSVPPPNGRHPVTREDGKVGSFDSVDAPRKWACAVPPGCHISTREGGAFLLITDRVGQGILYYTAEGRWVLLSGKADEEGVIDYETIRGRIAFEKLGLRSDEARWYAREQFPAEVARIFAVGAPIEVRRPAGFTPEQEVARIATVAPDYPKARDLLRAIQDQSGSDAHPNHSPAGTNAPDAERREDLVASYLEREPGATSQTIARAIGCSDSTVRKTDAWKNRRGVVDGKVKARRRPTEVPLTAKMLASRSAGVDPAEEVAQREVLEAKYLDRASADEKARYHSMDRACQDEALRLFAESEADQLREERRPVPPIRRPSF